MRVESYASPLPAAMLAEVGAGYEMVVVVYTFIQWKTAASVLQSGRWANTTVEAKVRTIQKTMIPLLSRENAPARRKRP